mmetsp:Transcript_2557/g.6110  ORF Transcript_2557/g.6110 Transcript_2557/m.6110 type:complete len:215 (-) Transcript_2557:1437-2081(-)
MHMEPILAAFTADLSSTFFIHQEGNLDIAKWIVALQHFPRSAGPREGTPLLGLRFQLSSCLRDFDDVLVVALGIEAVGAAAAALPSPLLCPFLQVCDPFGPPGPLCLGLRRQRYTGFLPCFPRPTLRPLVSRLWFRLVACGRGHRSRGSNGSKSFSFFPAFVSSRFVFPFDDSFELSSDPSSDLPFALFTATSTDTTSHPTSPTSLTSLTGLGL